MYLTVETAGEAPAVRLAEPDDFTRLKVVANGAEDWDALQRALGSVGRVDDGHVWLRVDALRELAGARRDDPAWSRGLDKMLAYAEQHGWVEGPRSAVRAHCEWTAAPPAAR